MSGKGKNGLTSLPPPPSGTGPSRSKTGKDIRQYVLDNVEPIMETVMQGAIESSPHNALSNQQMTLISLVWPMLTKVVTDASDNVNLFAQNTNDVISLISKGRVSLEEAIQLMGILRTQSDVEDIKAISEKLEMLGAHSGSRRA